jgi:hypothetical protein
MFFVVYMFIWLAALPKKPEPLSLHRFESIVKKYLTPSPQYTETQKVTKN